MSLSHVLHGIMNPQWKSGVMGEIERVVVLGICLGSSDPQGAVVLNFVPQGTRGNDLSLSSLSPMELCTQLVYLLYPSQ